MTPDQKYDVSKISISAPNLLSKIWDVAKDGTKISTDDKEKVPYEKHISILTIVDIQLLCLNFYKNPF